MNKITNNELKTTIKVLKFIEGNESSLNLKPIITFLDLVIVPKKQTKKRCILHNGYEVRERGRN